MFLLDDIIHLASNPAEVQEIVETNFMINLLHSLCISLRSALGTENEILGIKV